MHLQTRNSEKTLRIIVIVVLASIVCWGAILVSAEIKPFWVDEWRIIYNLKFKTPAALFGQLDYMQQFPRVYLVLVKLLTAPFDYSYSALRFPSFLIGVTTVLFSYHLMKKIFPAGHLNRFLFVMILVSSFTFTEYFVQVKQYTMDILLSLVAIAQLIGLLNLKNGKVNIWRYLVLCLSFAVVPFFSYTYPIAIAPAFAIIFLQTIVTIKNGVDTTAKRAMLLQWAALCIGAAAIGLFYVIDVAQLMRDNGMRKFWVNILMTNGFDWKIFYTNFYGFFAAVGSGAVFSALFGVLGLASFGYSIYKSTGRLFSKEQSLSEYLVLYSAALLVLVVGLFVMGKFPLGDPRLNAFTVPSIALLIISLLDGMKTRASLVKYSMGISLILYIGVIGNIYTSFYASVSGEKYKKTIAIYKATESAIVLAQEKKVPIFITPGVTYPYENTKNLPYDSLMPGDWVLKTFPAYKAGQNIPVYPLSAMSDIQQHIQTLPDTVTLVMAGDGISYQLISRQ